VSRPASQPDTGWRLSFVDIALCTIAVLFLLVHPPKTDEDSKPPGTIIVEATWPPACNSDIDLWVKAPGDQPVGYSNKAGAVGNLLRDDLGDDPSGQNIEFYFARFLADGDYAVTTHLYNAKKCPLPIKVRVHVYIRDHQQKSTITVKETTVSMSHVGEEITIVRWSMKDGRHSNVHDLPVKLRTRQ
jgi:hypothetical protein